MHRKDILIFYTWALITCFVTEKTAWHVVGEHEFS